MSKVGALLAVQPLSVRLMQVYVVLQDSPHFKNEQRKQAQTEERIRKMQVQAKTLTAGEVAHHTRCSTAMDHLDSNIKLLP